MTECSPTIPYARIAAPAMHAQFNAPYTCTMNYEPI